MKKLKYLTIVLVLLCVTACDGKAVYIPQSAWETAPVDHTCTAEQMAKAQNESAWCNENTSYLASYCYGSAILRNCTKMESNEKPQEKQP